MCKELNFIAKSNNTEIYSIGRTNNFIISNDNTCELLTNPEIIGYDIGRKFISPISDALKYFRVIFDLEDINVVNILRGGLNFPIEEACYNEKIKISGTSFLTSERLFADGKVSQVISKYKKILDISNATIIIGDIIASGETIYNTVHYIIEKYKRSKKTLKRIIVFTIGTVNAIEVMNKLESELKECWDSFVGIHFVFFEAVFTTYDSYGITKLNLPKVDFCFSGGLLAPKYRYQLFDDDYTLFEKCAIYDGGARRFEQNLHIDFILNYWLSLSKLKFDINPHDFFFEKMGYSLPEKFSDWVNINGYKKLYDNRLYDLYIREKQFFESIKEESIKSLATNRYNRLLKYYSKG